MTSEQHKHLVRRALEIDYTQKHRHLGGSLSCLRVMAEIYDGMTKDDMFILSKGHAAPAFYAVLEAHGYKPDITKPHPDYDPANGIVCTTGSLGHGLPVAVGMALAKKLRNEVGMVYCLMGDGEALEGTTWEALLLADALCLNGWLEVWVDCNGWQGSCKTIGRARELLDWMGSNHFPVYRFEGKRGEGIPFFEAHQDWHTHLITDAEYAQILEELK